MRSRRAAFRPARREGARRSRLDCAPASEDLCSGTIPPDEKRSLGLSVGDSLAHNTCELKASCPSLARLVRARLVSLSAANLALPRSWSRYVHRSGRVSAPRLYNSDTSLFSS